MSLTVPKTVALLPQLYACVIFFFTRSTKWIASEDQRGIPFGKMVTSPTRQTHTSPCGPRRTENGTAGHDCRRRRIRDWR